MIDAGMSSAANVHVSDYYNQVATITGLWQLWIDPAMSLTIIMPPGDADFSSFPLSENAFGRGLFEVLGVAADQAEAVALSRRFEFQKRILSAKFVRKNENGIARTAKCSCCRIFRTYLRSSGFLHRSF